tara:strand:- start:68 stop:262 length:195 start_codon:yes stop_codon:yes gene_type:complete
MIVVSIMGSLFADRNFTGTDYSNPRGFLRVFKGKVTDLLPKRWDSKTEETKDTVLVPSSNPHFG